jgi:hypothetical protein
MPIVDWVYVVAAFLLLIGAALPWLINPASYRVGELFHAGADVAPLRADDPLADAFRRLLLSQLRSSFLLMTGASIVGVACLMFALVKNLINPDGTFLAGLLGIVAGLGSTPLFRHYRDSWQECFRTLQPYFPPPPAPPVPLLDQLKRWLIVQRRTTYWVMFAAGAGALALLGAALVRAIVGTEQQLMLGLVEFIAALGDVALFAYLRRAWQLTQENMQPYFPTP